MLILKWNWGLAAKSLKHLAKLAKLATAVKAGDNEFTLYDGIKYLSNVDVVMKLRCSYQQLSKFVRAVKACESCQSCRQPVTAVKAGNSLWHGMDSKTSCMTYAPAAQKLLRPNKVLMHRKYFPSTLSLYTGTAIISHSNKVWYCWCKNTVTAYLLFYRTQVRS